MNKADVPLQRVVIQLPVEMVERLHQMRAEGYSTAGYVRAVMEKHFRELPTHNNTVAAHLTEQIEELKQQRELLKQKEGGICEYQEH